MSFIELESNGLVYMTSSNITAVHAFTTRLGGVSQGIYSSLNLGQNLGDEPDRVRENYKILGSVLDFQPGELVFTRQVHKTEVRLVGRYDRSAPYVPTPYEADGLITDERDVPLIIFTADCVPILLHDPVREAIGAVHAGWRGTVAGIACKAVEEMATRLGCDPKNIRAAIGPCISACCFETGPEVPEAVNNAAGGDASAFIRSKGDKYMVDLKGINRFLLERAGVLPGNIACSEECTSCLSDKYWSHRVTNGQRGSQASVIMLKGRTPA
jgi:YfiH family protein